MYHKAENWLELHNWAKLFMKSQLVFNSLIWRYMNCSLHVFWRKKHQQMNKHYLFLLVKYLRIGIRNWNFLKILSFHHMSTTNPEFWIYQFFEIKIDKKVLYFFKKTQFGALHEMKWKKLVDWEFRISCWHVMKKVKTYREIVWGY